MRSDSDESQSTFSKQVQFGRPASRVSSDSEESFKIYFEDNSSDSFLSENVNERLRHFMPQLQTDTEEAYLDVVICSVFTIVLQECLNQISIIREVNQMTVDNVNLDYTGLEEKYKNAEHEIDTIVDTRSEYLSYKKFRRNISWLERILNVTIYDLQNSFTFDGLQKALDNYRLTKEEEDTVLTSKEFNRRELKKLRSFMEIERREMSKAIQKLTEDVGNFKDQLNDNMAESLVKIKFVKEWEMARQQQNEMILKNKEAAHSATALKFNTEIEKESRVHDEMYLYLQTSLKEYQEEIEQWMEKYDADLENKEQQVQSLKISLENQKERYANLMAEYNAREVKMDAYKAHKLQRQKEEEELALCNHAATRIQAWWRGVMFRKGLGPYKRKKGKAKKGSTKK